MPKETKYKVGDVINTERYGSFTIIENLGLMEYSGAMCTWFKIRFNNTGTEMDVPARNLHRNIKDPYAKIKYGVGCLGKLDDISREDIDRFYGIWNAMMARCYNPASRSYKDYGGAGITVSEEWTCFEKYVKSVKSLKNYDKYMENPKGWAIDKDILQENIPKGERVYSKETCMFVPTRLNLQQRMKDQGIKSGYYGVEKHGNRYRTIVHESGKTFIIGSFNTAEEAAACYNNYMSIYYPYVRMNDVPYIPHDEIRAADLMKHVLFKPVKPTPEYPVQMCRIVDKKPDLAARTISPSEILKPFIQPPLKEMCRIIKK